LCGKSLGCPDFRGDLTDRALYSKIGTQFRKISNYGIVFSFGGGTVGPLWFTFTPLMPNG